MSSLPPSALSTLNLDVFHAINGLAGDRFWDTILASISDNYLLRSVLLGAPYVFFWFSRLDFESRDSVIAGLVGGGLSVVFARLLAHALPFETRPMYDGASGFRPLSTGFNFDLENWSSFPSDHAALATGMTLGLFRCNKLFSIVLAVIALFLFCAPRIYAGLHYPFDILGGACMGLVGAAIPGFSGFAPLWDLVRRMEKKAPALFYTASFLALVETSQMFNGVRSFVGMLRSAFFT